MSRPRSEPGAASSGAWLNCNIGKDSEQGNIVKALKKFTSADDILDFCIEQEEASLRLYSALADLMEQSEMALLFQDLAALEAGHKKKFQDLKESKTQLCVEANPPEIEIRDDLPPLSAGRHMGCQQAIGLAIKKEVIAALLYTKLAEIVEDEDARNLLWAIADEERRHKHHFDAEYEKCTITQSRHCDNNRR
jgi:rubrerythrin